MLSPYKSAALSHHMQFLPARSLSEARHQMCESMTTLHVIFHIWVANCMLVAALGKCFGHVQPGTGSLAQPGQAEGMFFLAGLGIRLYSSGRVR